MDVRREWGRRRGRGGARANSGGARPGAGRPRANGEGYVAFSGRLGPLQIIRAREIASERSAATGRDVEPAEVFRDALHGRVQLGPVTTPLKRHKLMLAPSSYDELCRRCGETRHDAVWELIRSILSGDSEHL